MVFTNKWFMRKIVYILLFVFITVLLSSCTNTKSCAAYGGEKSNFQRNPEHWTK